MANKYVGRAGKRNSRRTVLLVTNGTVTEKCYLNELKKRASKADLSVKVEAKSGEPLSVIRKYCSPAGNPGGYDEVWFIFDEDGKDLSEAMAQLRGKDSRSQRWVGVVSRPCFEVWLTAHYAPLRSYVDQAEAQRHYEQVAKVPRGGKALPQAFPYDAMGTACIHCSVSTDEPLAENQLPPSPGSAMPLLLRALGLVS